MNRCIELNVSNREKGHVLRFSRRPGQAALRDHAEVGPDPDSDHAGPGGAPEEDRVQQGRERGGRHRQEGGLGAHPEDPRHCRGHQGGEVKGEEELAHHAFDFTACMFR